MCKKFAREKKFIKRTEKTRILKILIIQRREIENIIDKTRFLIGIGVARFRIIRR